MILVDIAIPVSVHIVGDFNRAGLLIERQFIHDIVDLYIVRTELVYNLRAPVSYAHFLVERHLVRTLLESIEYHKLCVLHLVEAELPHVLII